MSVNLSFHHFYYSHFMHLCVASQEIFIPSSALEVVPNLDLSNCVPLSQVGRKLLVHSQLFWSVERESFLNFKLKFKSQFEHYNFSSFSSTNHKNTTTTPLPRLAFF